MPFQGRQPKRFARSTRQCLEFRQPTWPCSRRQSSRRLRMVSSASALAVQAGASRQGSRPDRSPVDRLDGNRPSWSIGRPIWDCRANSRGTTPAKSAFDSRCPGAAKTAYGPKNAISDSRGGSFIEVEESAKPFAATDETRLVGSDGRWKGNDIAEPLVIPFGVIVRDEFSDRSPQMTLAQWDDVAEALLLDRANEPLRIGVGKTYQLLGMRTLRRKLSG
jgi:hypothetical protein